MNEMTLSGLSLTIMDFHKSTKFPQNSMYQDERQKWSDDYLTKLQIFYDYILSLDKETIDKVDYRLLNVQLPVFNLAYLGINVRPHIELWVKIYRYVFGSFIEKINNRYMSSSRWKKPYLKILFASNRINKFSSVVRDRGQIIAGISKDPCFSVDILTELPIIDLVKPLYTNCNILQSKTLLENLSLVGNGRYDIIIYPDLHMDPATSLLPLFRLAPVQITTFGHSETSGLCDYFITSKYFMTPNSNSHFTENVYRMNSLNMKYSHIVSDEHRKKFKDRSFFSLTDTQNVYVCSSSSFKLGAEMIDIFQKIVSRDKNSVIIITKLSEDLDKDLFMAIGKKLSVDEMSRIRFINRLDTMTMMNLLEVADVFLESYPFGNLNTTFECFEAGLPVITYPTEKMNGRFTYGLYTKMDVLDYIAVSLDDYVDIAVKVATEKDILRRKEIKEQSAILFNEEQSVKEWIDLLKSL